MKVTDHTWWGALVLGKKTKIKKHRTNVTPGPQNRSDNAGDGPAPLIKQEQGDEWEKKTLQQVDAAEVQTAKRVKIEANPPDNTSKAEGREGCGRPAPGCHAIASQATKEEEEEPDWGKQPEDEDEEAAVDKKDTKNKKRRGKGKKKLTGNQRKQRKWDMLDEELEKSKGAVT